MNPEPSVGSCNELIFYVLFIGQPQARGRAVRVSFLSYFDLILTYLPFRSLFFPAGSVTDSKENKKSFPSTLVA